VAGQRPFTDRGTLDATAERLPGIGELPDARGDVLLHGTSTWQHPGPDGHAGALIDFEFARTGPPDLELISVIRAPDMETRLGVPCGCRKPVPPGRMLR
jgi:hypothetical protein